MSGIVVAADGSPGARDALALGAALSGVLGVAATVVCVYPPRPLSARVGGTAFEDRDEDGAQRILDAVAWPEAARHAVCASTPALGLRMVAQERDADVVVVGSSHRHGLGRALPGTTAMHLVAERRWPVAIAADGGRGLQRMALAYDGTGSARRALAFASMLAQRAHATLTVLDVAVPSTPVELARYGPGPAAASHIGAEPARQAAREDLAEALAELPPGLAATTRLLDGDAPHQLVDASADFDLMVIGSRGHGVLERLLLGSTSDAVAAGTHCPLVVVPDADADR